MAPIRQQVVRAIILLTLAAVSARGDPISADGEVTRSQRNDPVERWRDLITEAAARFGISAAWIHDIIRAESGGLATLDGRPITSPAGAMGLMQIMPRTYADLRERYRLGGDPYDAHDNIMAGAAYLREMFDRYGYPNLFVAYNAGPARLEAYLRRGEALPRETVNYVGRVVSGEGSPQTIHRASPPSLFFRLSQNRTRADRASSLFQTAVGAGLFVPLNTSLPRG